MKLLQKFEPHQTIQQDYQHLLQFPKYKQNEADYLMNMIQSSYKIPKFYENSQILKKFQQKQKKNILKNQKQKALKLKTLIMTDKQKQTSNSLKQKVLEKIKQKQAQQRAEKVNLTTLLPSRKKQKIDPSILHKHGYRQSMFYEHANRSETIQDLETEAINNALQTHEERYTIFQRRLKNIPTFLDTIEETNQIMDNPKIQSRQKISFQQNNYIKSTNEKLQNSSILHTQIPKQIKLIKQNQNLSCLNPLITTTSFQRKKTTTSSPKKISSYNQQPIQNTLKYSPKVNIMKPKYLFLKNNIVGKKDIISLKTFYDEVSSFQGKSDISTHLINLDNNKSSSYISQQQIRILNKNKQQFKTLEFKGLIQKIYPDINQSQFKLVNSWLSTFESIKERESKQYNFFKATDNSKRKLVSKKILFQLYQLFKDFDQDKKGYIDYQDLVRKFKYGFSEAQLKKLFLSYQNSKQNICFAKFLKMVLPDDYVANTDDIRYILSTSQI